METKEKEQRELLILAEELLFESDFLDYAEMTPENVKDVLQRHNEVLFKIILLLTEQNLQKH